MWGGGLTCTWHIPPHPAQPRHTNHWAPRTRKRHQRERRPQRPTESSDPTQHAKGRTGDCPGPRKETATRRNVTRGGGGGGKLGSRRVCSGRVLACSSHCGPQKAPPATGRPFVHHNPHLRVCPHIHCPHAQTSPFLGAASLAVLAPAVHAAGLASGVQPAARASAASEAAPRRRCGTCGGVWSGYVCVCRGCARVGLPPGGPRPRTRPLLSSTACPMTGWFGRMMARFGRRLRRFPGTARPVAGGFVHIIEGDGVGVANYSTPSIARSHC